jgi:hypothetical protein
MQVLDDITEETVRLIKAETQNSGFALSCNEREWTLIVTETATKFTGTLQEVLHLYIEEITSYRTESFKRKHVKIRKPFSYNKIPQHAKRTPNFI